MTGAQALARSLRRSGVEAVFFVTGSPLNLWPALEDEQIRLVLCRSEKGAAYMADAYARVSGRPGVCLAQQGPGAANLCAGIAEPWMASSPVVAITHNWGPARAQKHLYQELDQMRLYDPITKFNFQIADAGRIADAVHNAMHVAVSGNPRPVHLDFLDSVATGEVDLAQQLVGIEYRTPGHRIQPHSERVRAACNALLSAARPVIVAGHGTIISEAWEEVQALAEMLSIPVATSLSGKGSLAETHPLSVGVVGGYSHTCANQTVGEADLVFYIGSKAGGMVTDNFQIPPVGTRVIHLDIDPQVIGSNYPAEVALVGDAKLGLKACVAELQDRIPLQSSIDTSWVKRVQKRVEDWRREASDVMRSEQSPIHPARAIHEIREFLDNNDLVVADTGYMGAWAGVLYEVRQPGRTVIRAAGSLGWALPAAIGAKVAAPERRVLAVIGDGGLGYHITELETAVRCNIPIVVAVLNNVSLAFEYHILKYMQGGKAYSAADLNNAQYARIAEGFGAFGRRVEEPGDIQDALGEAFASGKPALLEIMVDKEAIAPVTYYSQLMEKRL